MNKILFIIVVLLLCSFTQSSFKTTQKQYPRVRQAYADKEKSVTEILKTAHLNKDSVHIYLRVFKYEKELELWGKNKNDKTFKLLKVYDICRTCGKLGPKRRQGDLQIPEGFYHIDAFNPASSYYLSMRVNYPNASDKKLGVQNQLGSNICIHGSCVTIGCIPITDDQIKELYIFCIEAKNNGQQNIPVTFFPARLSKNNLKKIKEKYFFDEDKMNLWTDLQKAWLLFNKTKQLPHIKFLEDGRHSIQ